MNLFSRDSRARPAAEAERYRQEDHGYGCVVGTVLRMHAAFPSLPAQNMLACKRSE
jgi:hypothetical protein